MKIVLERILLVSPRPPVNTEIESLGITVPENLSLTSAKGMLVSILATVASMDLATILLIHSRVPLTLLSSDFSRPVMLMV